MNVIKVENKDNPATEEEIEEVRRQLQAVANDPNLTFVHYSHIVDFDGKEAKDFMANCKKNENNN